MPYPSQAICCVVTRDYLPGLIILYRSVLKYQRLPLYLLVVDADSDALPELHRLIHAQIPDAAPEELIMVDFADLLADDLPQVRFYYDAFELATAAKAYLHFWMQHQTDIEHWLYLDTDMVCYGSLTPIFEQLRTSNFLLTPHCPNPCQNPSQDIQFLTAGAYNGGLLGVTRSADSAAFTLWYKQVLTHYCLNDPPLAVGDRFVQSTVLFVDQRWLDLVPAYFRGVAIAAERGFNLGHWNVGQDRLYWNETQLCIGSEDVLLLHLSGFLPEASNRLSKHSPIDWADSNTWLDIHLQQKTALETLQQEFTFSYPYANYPDGSSIPKSHRRAYLKHLMAGGSPVANPFLHKADFERVCRPTPGKTHYRWA